MALDVLAFRERFPEFRSQDSALIASCIEEASARLDASYFGTRIDSAVGQLAAHLIAVSPFGEFARLDPRKEPDGCLTIYDRELKRMRCELLVLPTAF